MNAADPNDERENGLQRGWVRITADKPGGATKFKAHAIPISSLVHALDFGDVDRIVVDETGLTGVYDMTFPWNPARYPAQLPSDTSNSPIAADPAPTIESALQDNLGLCLEPRKMPMDALVIDRVEKPSEN